MTANPENSPYLLSTEQVALVPLTTDFLPAYLGIEPTEIEARLQQICADPQISKWTTVPPNYQLTHAQFFINICQENWKKFKQNWADFVAVVSPPANFSLLDSALKPLAQKIRIDGELTWAICAVDTTTGDGTSWNNQTLDIAGQPITCQLSRAQQFLGVIGARFESSSTNAHGEIGCYLAPEARQKGFITQALRCLTKHLLTPDPGHPFAFLNLASLKYVVIGYGKKDVNWPSIKAAWRCGYTLRGCLPKYEQRNGQLIDHYVSTISQGDPLSPQCPWFGPESSHPERAYQEKCVGLANERDPESLVRQFHHTYGLPIEDTPNAARERIHMRMSLIAEEFAELVGAVYGSSHENTILDAFAQIMAQDQHNRDVVETADALADLVYVTYGMALELGIDLPAVLREVQASNMSKLGADGKPIYRADGKVLKGPNFFPPNVEAVLKQPKREFPLP